MSKSAGKNWPSHLLRAVETSLEALPSEKELQESIEAIDALISFLQELRTYLSQQPSAAARHDVIKATNMLCSFLNSHNVKPLFASKSKKLEKHGAQQSTEEMFEELRNLSLNDIQNRLLDDGRYSVRELKSLAGHLNIGVDKNMRRHDIADVIFKRGFANPRAYDAIGGQAAQKIAEKNNKYMPDIQNQSENKPPNRK